MTFATRFALPLAFSLLATSTGCPDPADHTDEDAAVDEHPIRTEPSEDDAGPTGWQPDPERHPDADVPELPPLADGGALDASPDADTDAGEPQRPEPDAGLDAGEGDAGEPDAGELDAGEELDAGCTDPRC